MAPLTTQNSVHKFIGLVYYQRYMWERNFYALEILTDLKYSKDRFKWTEVEQKSFKEIKWIVSCIDLLYYADFNK